MDAVTRPRSPVNEPVRDYAPGSPERAALEAGAGRARRRPRSSCRTTIGGGRGMARAARRSRSSPAARPRRTCSATLRQRHPAPTRRPRSTRRCDAAPGLARAVLRRPRRDPPQGRRPAGRPVARSGSTPRPCSASPRPRYQAEIDAACELIDFWRFNVALRPADPRRAADRQRPGIWNRTDHRPLEGFVYAITPFNFTAIAGNLPTAPGADGQHRGLEAVADPAARRAPDHGAARGGRAAARASSTWSPATASTSPRSRWPTRDLAGIHFTGSTPTFQHLWRDGRREHRAATAPTRASSARPAARTSSSPTPRADPDVLRTALIRGAFEYQGQKCSAASRAYVPRVGVGADAATTSSPRPRR